MARPKPREKNVQVGFRLPAQKKALIEKRARREGVSVQKYIEECLDLRLGLPDSMLEETRKATREMQLPVTTVLANMIIKQSSFNQTWHKVFGKMPPGAMKEFKLEGGRLLTGDELLVRLNAEHEKEITKLKNKLAGAAMGNKNVTLTASEDELLATGL
jgi:hypothetical protein